MRIGSIVRRWLWLFIIVLFVGLVVWYYQSQPPSTAAGFDFGFIQQHFFDPKLIQGAQMTIFLSVVAQLIGILLGLIAAMMKISKNPVLRGISSSYIWLFRGTPLLVQLVVFATGLYEIQIHLDLLTAALLALSLNEGAYMAEIVRAGILSIDSGQMEAAKSLGMTYAQGMRRIVLPQAARVILPPTGNEFNNMLKSSSLVTTISVYELFKYADDLNHFYFKTLEIFAIVSCYYLAMTTVTAWGQGWMERRLGAHTVREEELSLWGRVRGNIFSTRAAH